MDITIQQTKLIPLSILTQVKQFSPREGLKTELGNPEPSDIRVQCAWENYAGYILDEGTLVSFAIIAQDDNFNKNIAQTLGLDPNKTAVMMYLFTVPVYQRQGHAKTLLDALAKYIKNPLGGEELLRTRTGEINKELYIKYGAKLSSPIIINDFIKQQGLEKSYYFRYSI